MERRYASRNPPSRQQPPWQSVGPHAARSFWAHWSPGLCPAVVQALGLWPVPEHQGLLLGRLCRAPLYLLGCFFILLLKWHDATRSVKQLQRLGRELGPLAIPIQFGFVARNKRFQNDFDLVSGLLAFDPAGPCQLNLRIRLNFLNLRCPLLWRNRGATTTFLNTHLRHLHFSLRLIPYRLLQYLTNFYR